MKEKREIPMRCTMCGYEFDAERLECHAACPLGAGCMVVCCPRCGYSTVNTGRARTARWLERMFGRKASPGRTKTATGLNGEPLVSIMDMRAGQEGQIADVGGDTDRLLQLSQYGLMPGTPVRLFQKRPVPVIQVGQTDLALDAAVAGEIMVEI